MTDDHRIILVVLAILCCWWLQTCWVKMKVKWLQERGKEQKSEKVGKKEAKSKFPWCTQQGQLLPPASSAEMLKFASKIQKYFGSQIHTCMHI